MADRIKKAMSNPAKEGAILDRKGIKYSGERGTKTFFKRRRENIEKVNHKMGFLSSDSDNSDDDLNMREVGSVTGGGHRSVAS